MFAHRWKIGLPMCKMIPNSNFTQKCWWVSLKGELHILLAGHKKHLNRCNQPCKTWPCTTTGSSAGHWTFIYLFPFNLFGPDVLHSSSSFSFFFFLVLHLHTRPKTPKSPSINWHVNPMFTSSLSAFCSAACVFS